MDEKVFGRRYRLTEKIGTGGMADVFKAVDEVLGRTVAVKVMHPRYAADPNFAARFRQEAQAAANLQSPYIVNIYDWGQDGDTYYIVMELVRGTDLKTLIQQRGPMPSQRAAEFGAQVCSALAVAHGYDVIHRDIKPHNIMMAPDGSVKVMDFGIARAGNTTMTQTGSVLGTAHYVSPEQAQGRPLTPASDLYSLGVVLYEAVTGRLPFDADSPVAVALKQVNEQPVPPRQVNPNVDPGLEAVIMKAMAKQPTDRYQTANEMRQDLMRVMQGGDVTAVLPAAIAAAGPAAAAAGETAVMPAVGGPEPGPIPAPMPGRREPVRRKRRIWPWLLVAALLVAAGLVAAWQLGLFEGGVAVPNVVGMQRRAAEQAITDAGFTVGDIKSEFNDAPKGEVLDQSPIAGFLAEKESPINLTVSRGPELVEVPRVIGLREEDAVNALREAGLTPVPAPDEYRSDVTAGIVFNQSPKQGAKLEKGAEVQYVVSRGKKTATVPDVVGKSREDATAILQRAGFRVARTEAFSTDQPAGRVISQSPGAGFEGVEGSTVSIVISKGPESFEAPDVIGQTMQEAIATIENAGFKADVAYELHQGNGLVIDQDPPGGTMLKKNAKIRIVVDAEKQ